MIKDYVKIFLFLNSYALLFLIIAIKNYTETYLAISIGVLILISIIFLLYIIRKLSKMNGTFFVLFVHRDQTKNIFKIKDKEQFLQMRKNK